jgi:hypothetical protein
VVPMLARGPAFEGDVPQSSALIAFGPLCQACDRTLGSQHPVWVDGIVVEGAVPRLTGFNPIRLPLLRRLSALLFREGLRNLVLYNFVRAPSSRRLSSTIRLSSQTGAS